MNQEPETISDLQTCPRCRGTRVIIVGLLGPGTPEPCPKCGGLGYVPQNETKEAGN